MSLTETHRQYLGEFTGTFGIVFAPVAYSAAMSTRGGGNLLEAATVSGLIVLAMIASLGHISSAHFNPAVTIGMWSVKRFPQSKLMGYLMAQFGGSLLASMLSFAICGIAKGTHAPTIPWTSAVLCEMVITFFLMILIMAVGTDADANTSAAIAVGLYVVAGVLVGGTLTGGSMNPARSFGPAVFAGGTAYGSLPIYFVGPIIGALIAAKLYEILRETESPDNACSDIR